MKLTGSRGHLILFQGRGKSAMPRKSRRPYSAEFRRQMVERAATGRAPSELEREVDITVASIRNWIAGKPPPGKEALSIAERQELVRLRRENRRLQMERDILAEATAWFANKKSEEASIPSSNS